VYRQLGAENNFTAKWTPETHSWTPADRDLIVQFFADNFKLQAADTDHQEILTKIPNWHIEFPKDSLTVDRLAEKLSGKKMPEGTTLFDIFKPKIKGLPIVRDEIIADIGRGDVMKILAQLECALTEKGNI
jgi:hypothetical protein